MPLMSVIVLCFHSSSNFHATFELLLWGCLTRSRIGLLMNIILKQKDSSQHWFVVPWNCFWIEWCHFYYARINFQEIPIQRNQVQAYYIQTSGCQFTYLKKQNYSFVRWTVIYQSSEVQNSQRLKKKNSLKTEVHFSLKGVENDEIMHK